MKTEVKYSSDLTNRQWQLIRQLLPPQTVGWVAGRSTDDGLSMRFCMWFAPAASGGCCPATFRTGARCTAFFGAGEMMALGKRFTTPCGPKRGER